ncbi:ParE family toxin-like protein [Spirosoma endophyticum]|uniref:ParE-like toxin domain-containing protein n=1 Tax=Spirosoma endophyticum TaxID=662367 RepID=A0A1I1IU91_9BACT|nr:hypothetical protein [Spirosoma endophyticum]SFC39796.1 hypothetical protein SAMN05216167_1011018 [Spirosoma endophyticum]
MNHHTTTKFWKRYYSLSEAIQELADKNFDLLKADPLHPSLHFKEISGKDNLWAARVGDHFRALAIREDNELYWFWIGSHSEYDRIISQ